MYNKTLHIWSSRTTVVTPFLLLNCKDGTDNQEAKNLPQLTDNNLTHTIQIRGLQRNTNANTLNEKKGKIYINKFDKQIMSALSQLWNTFLTKFSGFI